MVVAFDDGGVVLEGPVGVGGFDGTVGGFDGGVLGVDSPGTVTLGVPVLGVVSTGGKYVDPGVDRAGLQL